MLLSRFAGKHFIIHTCQRNILKKNVNKKKKNFAFRSVSDILGLIPRIYVSRKKEKNKKEKHKPLII